MNLNKRNLKQKILLEPHYKSVYYIAFGFFVFAFAVVLFFSHGTSEKTILFQDTTNTFMDHLNSVIYNEIDPYENRVIYPPLACLAYKLCNMIIPEDEYYSVVTDATKTAQSTNVKLSQGFIFELFVFLLIIGLLFIISVDLVKKGSSWEKLSFLATIGFSSPFLFLMDRGNNMLIPLAFSLIFIGYYDNENKIKRELALIALAIAVGFKLYPALFAVVLITEKRWKEFFRTVLYCIATTILPFFIFYNGVESLVTMLKSITGFSSSTSSSLEKFNTCLDFKHIFLYCYTIINKGNVYRFGEEIALTLATLARYTMAIVCGLNALITKKRWKQAMFVAAVIYGFPGSCSTYLLLFFTIPLLLLLDEEKECSLLNYLYLGLMLLTMVPLPLPHDLTFDRYASSKVSSIAVGIIVFIGLIELIVYAFRFCKDFCKRFGKEKNKLIEAKKN